MNERRIIAWDSDIFARYSKPNGYHGDVEYVGAHIQTGDLIVQAKDINHVVIKIDGREVIVNGIHLVTAVNEMIDFSRRGKP